MRGYHFLVCMKKEVGIPPVFRFQTDESNTTVLGILKNCIPQTHASISSTLESYYGPVRKPTVSLRAPHLPSYSPPHTPPRSSTPSSHTDGANPSPKHLNVLLLSSNDGRDTMVDLTKTLAEMAQKDSLNPRHISADLIDMELTDAVSGEPDLLILFSPTIELKGYPPWQLRLTEILYVHSMQSHHSHSTSYLPHFRGK